MSQEQPPIRSRRELRQARDERQDTKPGAGTEGAGAAPAAPGQEGSAGSAPQPEGAAPAFSERPEAPTEAETTGRRRIPGPVDSVPASTPAERSSQVRARDRAALRTIKELAEKEGQLSPGGPPTRRQLRLQQLAEETAPATSANPIVPSPRTRTHPAVAQAAKRPADQPEAAQHTAPAADAEPTPGTLPAAQAAEAGNEPDGKLPERMSVEQALAARELLAAQARNQVAKMEHISATDPDAVDPEMLAEQIALAERAAVLNRRAAAKQKLAQQNSQPAQQRTEAPKNDPSTASNLAMVTPLEFVQVPGVERPVMKRPATSYVPLVTNSSPKVQPSKTSRRNGQPRKRDAAAVNGRAGVLARAEAAAQAASSRRPARAAEPENASVQAVEEEFAARPPVAANAAYGLDPLDAATAGLGRAQRLRALQLGVLALGLLALIAGIILIITGMAH